MPRDPKFDPPEPDGAAERLRQFEQARGFDPDAGEPVEETDENPETDAGDAVGEPPPDGTTTDSAADNEGENGHA